MAIAARTDNPLHGICLEVFQHEFRKERNNTLCFKEPGDPLYRIRSDCSLCIVAG